MSLSYRTANLAPEIARLDVPDLSIADGAVRQTRLNLRWEASDPNEDDLEFTVFVRKEGWPEWIRLNEDPITERNYSWDTTAFPSGLVPGQGRRQRPSVQQPRRCPHSRAREPQLPGGSRPAARPAGIDRSRAPASRWPTT